MKDHNLNLPHKGESFTTKVHSYQDMDATEKIDVIAQLLLKAITRKSNPQLQKEGA
ncbi:hypothetical protein ACUXOD_001440 [Bacillus sp. 153480037-1]